MAVVAVLRSVCLTLPSPLTALGCSEISVSGSTAVLMLDDDTLVSVPDLSFAFSIWKVMLLPKRHHFLVICDALSTGYRFKPTVSSVPLEDDSVAERMTGTL